MTNFDTITAITENIKKSLDALGLRFTNKAYADERSIPASMLPLGRIIYTGEVFDDAFGQKPGYADAEFVVKATFSEKEPGDSLPKRQELAHLIKGALTIDALNSGALSEKKLVSKVSMQKIDVESKDGLASIICRVTARYRRV